MAGSGAMAELARLPVSRKVLLFAVIGGVLGLGYWKLVYKSLDEELDQVRAEHTARLQTTKRLGADLPKYEELRSQKPKLNELNEHNQVALPSGAELPAFFETLQRKVAESGASVHKWTNRNEEPAEGFVKIPVEVEMTGTFMQLKRFFASLTQRDTRRSRTLEERASEQHERIVSIESLALSGPAVRNREIILTAKFVAVTFRKEEKPATSDKPGAAPSANGLAKPAIVSPPSPASPAPPPSSSSPPPLPSAASPAGAKARVDRALDKADARNRNAGGVDEAKLPAAGNDRLKDGL